jgi:hypothetical protein
MPLGVHGLDQIGALVHPGPHQEIVSTISKRSRMLQACGALPALRPVKNAIMITTQVPHFTHLSLLQNPNQKAMLQII